MKTRNLLIALLLVLTIASFALATAPTGTDTTYGFFRKAPMAAGAENAFNDKLDLTDAYLHLLGQVQSFYRLRVKNNAATPASKIDISADAVTVFNATNVPLILRNFSKTVDCTTTGANGLDAGSLATGWYYFYVIAKADGTNAGLASTSATNPVMPTGYTYKKLVSTIYNYLGSFVYIDQCDKEVTYKQVAGLVPSITSSSWESKDISATIPPNATHAKIRASVTTNSFDIGVAVAWSNSIADHGYTFAAKVIEIAIQGSYASTIPVDYYLNPSAPQTIYVVGADGNNRGTLTCLGYKLDL